MRSPRQRVLLLATLALALVALVWLGARTIRIELLDFEHYRQAAQLLWSRRSPYGLVEFFAPPWMALLLAPFILLPASAAAIAWLLLNLAAMGGAGLLAARWLDLRALHPRWEVAALAASVVMPAALYCYITGQISPLVGLAVLVLLYVLARGRPSPWVAAGVVLLASLKIHIVILPLGICLLELLRRREWTCLLGAGLALGLASLIGFWFDPAWPSRLLIAWMDGNFRGGQPGLVSPGFQGLSDLGAPPWLFAGHALYLLMLWWRGGLRPVTAAQAFALGLLLVPYWRSYDLVVLALPLLVLGWRGLQGDWLALPAAGLALLILPLTPLAILTPVVLELSLLWVYRAELAVAIRPANASEPALST